MKLQMVKNGERELGIPSIQVRNGGMFDRPRLQRLQYDNGRWVGRAAEDDVTNIVCQVDEQERPRESIGGSAGGERAFPNRYAFVPT